MKLMEHLRVLETKKNNLMITVFAFGRVMLMLFFCDLNKFAFTVKLQTAIFHNEVCILLPISPLKMSLD